MKPIFHFHTPRTGGTFIARLVSQHPDVAVFREFPLDPSSVFAVDSDKAIRHGFTREDLERWQKLKRPEDTIPQQAAAQYNALFEEFAEREGVETVFYSWPGWWGLIPFIKEFWPGSTCILTVRDPRATWWSAAFREQDDGAGTVCLDVLGQCLNAVSETSGDLNVMGYRYEELIYAPEQTMHQIWEAMGLDPLKGWIAYDEKKDKYPQRWQDVPNAIHAPNRDKVKEWWAKMPSAQQVQVTQDYKEIIEQWEYPPGTRPGLGDIMNHFMKGKSLRDPKLRELAKVAGVKDLEALLRGELIRLAQAFGETRTDLQSLIETLDDEARKFERMPYPQEWKRGYARAWSQGVQTACDAIGHLQNRYIRRMVM